MMKGTIAKALKKMRTIFGALNSSMNESKIPNPITYAPVLDVKQQQQQFLVLWNMITFFTPDYLYTAFEISWNQSLYSYIFFFKVF